MRKMAGQHPYKLQLAGSLIYQSKLGGILNWKSINKDFNTQLRQAGLIKNHSKDTLNKLRVFVISIGKALLEIRRSKDEISESSALWWGIGVLLAILLLILGIIPISWFFKFGSHWLGK